MQEIWLMNSPENIYLKVCSASFSPRAWSASLLVSTVNSFQGAPKVSDCRDLLPHPCRSGYQVTIFSWQGFVGIPCHHICCKWWPWFRLVSPSIMTRGFKKSPKLCHLFCHDLPKIFYVFFLTCRSLPLNGVKFIALYCTAVVYPYAPMPGRASSILNSGKGVHLLAQP